MELQTLSECSTKTAFVGVERKATNILLLFKLLKIKMTVLNKILPGNEII